MLILRFFSTFSAILLFFSIELSSSSNLTILSLNSPQVLSLHCADSLTLKILANSSFTFGTFHIAVKIIDPQLIPSLLLVSNLNCENDSSFYKEKMFSQQVFDSDNSIIVSFTLDASIDQCFKIRTLSSTRCRPTNYSIVAKFTPITTLFELNKSTSFELSQNFEKEFACDLANKTVEMVLISINSIQDNLILSSEEDYFELRHFEGLCIKTSSPRSWLCSLGNRRGIMKFSLYNLSPYKSHKILISEIWPQKVEPNIQGMIIPSVPGLGTFFTVSLSLNGVLKLWAHSKDHKPLPIITSVSLPGLITKVFHQQKRFFSIGSEINLEEASIIANTQANTEWFYFIPERDDRPSFISSCFQKLATAQIDIPNVFYIDPKVFEYQIVQLRLTNRKSFEKYQINLFSQSNSSLSLYLNRYSFGLECILGQNKSSICKEGISASSQNTEQLSLTFEAEPLDFTIFIIVKASKKGFYTLEVVKSNSESVLRTVLFISLITYFAISFFWYLYKLNRKRVTSNPNESSIQPEYLERGIDPPSPLHSDLEMNRFQSDFAVSDSRITREVKFRPNLIRMIEKYKRQENLEHMRSLVKKEVTLESNVDQQSIKDHENEERCDICFENRESMTFEPCAHACACIFCAIIIAQTSSACPLCRAQITEIKLPDNHEI